MNRDILALALALTPYAVPIPSSEDSKAKNLAEWITKALDKCVSRRRPQNGRPTVPWWNEDIGILRAECLKMRRAYQRRRKRVGEANSREQLESWKNARRQLAKSIKEAKEMTWNKLISLVDSDVWGKPYKVVMKRLRQNGQNWGIELPGRLESIVNGLFPTGEPFVRDLMTTETVYTTPFSLGEIETAAKSLPNKKAPGPDEIPNEVIKVAVACFPQRFSEVYNECWSKGRFPATWKTGRLVLLNKPGRPLDSPSAYRPICLLDGCGKLLEKLVVSRLRNHTSNSIADNQYGFRQGRSTLDALRRLKEIVGEATTGRVTRMVGMLTLDVRNAFNSAPWKAILEAAKAKKIPKEISQIISDYLAERKIIVRSPTGGVSFEKKVSMGVPQGSVLGPDLWNLFYDELLRLRMPDGVELLAYADDVAVLCSSEVPYVIEERLEETFVIINAWMSTHGLQLAPEKSEAILITKRRVFNEISVNCAGHIIESQASIRYLGVQIDKKMGFNTHAEIAAGRAAETARQLGYLMPNLRGPKQQARRLLASVTTSRLLYAAPFWADTMEERAWKKMATVHRRSQLRVTCCYRTVSHAAAAVISSIPPIRLLAKERAEIGNGQDKEAARRALLVHWQNEWDIGTEGRWTHSVIGNVKKWVTRSFGEVNFHMAQVLSGHGCFAAYLARFHIQESIVCEQCGAFPDDAEHGFFKCDAWENWRRQACVELGIGELTKENLMDTMLTSKRSWTIVSDLMKRIMSTREAEERRRQGQQI